LKRKNFSANTIKNYLNGLKQFLIWVDVPIEEVDYRKVLYYVDFQLERRRSARTINCHLSRIRLFYDYLIYDQGLKIDNPVKEGSSLRMPKPLPLFLKDEHVDIFLKAVENRRDKAIFMLMLRSGLRVAEVAELTLGAIEFQKGRLMVYSGKGSKDRIVYMSKDALKALVDYLQHRPRTQVKHVFLVERGAYKGQVISVRGIQKRIEYYACRAGIKVSCHRLRHTMATQMLNAGAGLESIQDLLGHERIKTTQRYCKISNLKVQKDYYETMDRIIAK
jgi:site-specific recombinase XerD